MHLLHSLRKLELTLHDFMPQLPQTTLVEIHLSIEQFKVDRLQIIVVAKKYISTCRNCSSVGCLKCVQFHNWFRLH